MENRRENERTKEFQKEKMQTTKGKKSSGIGIGDVI